MKLRNGYVSNSSSSSFLIVYKEDGVLHGMTFEEMYQKLNDRYDEACNVVMSGGTLLFERIVGHPLDKFNIKKGLNKCYQDGWKFVQLEIANHEDVPKFILNSFEEAGIIDIVDVEAW